MNSEDGEQNKPLNDGNSAMDAQTQTTRQLARKKKIKWGIIGILIAIAIILAIVLPIVLTRGSDNPVPPPPITGFNDYSIDPTKVVDTQNEFFGILNGKFRAEKEQTLFTKSFIQRLSADTANLEVDSKNIVSGVNNKIIEAISFKFEMINPSIARMTMTDANNQRFSPPEDVVPKPKQDIHQQLEMVGFSYKPSPFSFSFIDPVDSSNVFVSTEGQTLFMMDKFIQMDFVLPSQRIYGFGERVREFTLTPGTWTMWATQPAADYDDGSGRKNAYGVHPFILVQGKNKGDYFGMYFRNSNAQSPVIRYIDGQKSVLSYITIGGQIEAYFILHGSAKSIIQKYQSLIGTPQLPPFWALGWQQSSYKYTTQTMVEDVVKAYKDANINLETIYLDIPYMNKFTDFTVDTVNFQDLKTLTTNLHTSNQKIVPIIDAGLSAEDLQNKYYTTGNNASAFLKSGIYQSAKYNGNLISTVYPNHTVFLDWLNKKCMDVWTMGLDDLYNIFPYDGLWLDMNEPAAFQSGEVTPDDITEPLPIAQKTLLLSDGDTQWYTHFGTMDKESTYNLPFIPQFEKYGNFDMKTLSLNATHPGYNNETEYNLHNLFGHMEAWRTHQHMTQNSAVFPKDNRPFILSRSTFASSGRFAAHWLGDNHRTWADMKYSIAGIMNMNMFGIPQVGADICGYQGGETLDQEMCGRWIQLATFYPNARVHQDNVGDIRTEPYNLKGDFLTMAQQSIASRYQYLRLMYTCLYEVSRNGGSCFDPLFYHYPNDDNLFTNIEESFIVASALKVSPVLDALGTTGTYTSYFPKGTFVDLNHPTNVIDTSAGGSQQKLSLSQPTVQVHLKDGSLIPFQDNSDGSVKTTTDLLTRPVTLIANRDANGQAQGSLLLDNGISISEIANNKHAYYKFSLQANSLQVYFKDGDQNIKSGMTFNKLQIVNAQDLQRIDNVCIYDHNLNITPLKVTKDGKKNTVEFSSIDTTPIQFSDIKIIYFGTKGFDINMCSTDSFNYKLKDGQTVNLDASSAQFVVQPYLQPLLDLKISLSLAADNIVHIKWNYNQLPDDYNKPFEVPIDIIPDMPVGSKLPLSTFITVQNDPFQITVLSGGRYQAFTIYGLMLGRYLNVIKSTAFTQSANQFTGIFGLGERANPDFFYKDGVYSMWAKDIPTPIENGKAPGNNLYGTHPFYMYKLDTAKWMGVFTNLASAQDWYIKNDAGNGQVDIQAFAPSGLADIYVILGTKPEEVTKGYFKIIGSPVLVPQWSLGWNQCRYGYNNTKQLEDVVAGYQQNNLPLDVMWSDIDYLQNYRDFTYDKADYRYKDLPNFIKTLQNNNMHYVPIIDAGVSLRPNVGYKAYDDGKKDDVFMKIKKGEDLIAQVWPKDSVFPDWFNEKTAPWWQAQLTSMHNDIPFDGLWLDMNEASDFCGGLCYQSQQVDSPVKYKLPYVPTGRDLEEQSMPLDTFSANGVIQLDSHNLFGTQEIQATDAWYQSQKQRTFIISRNSFSGIGKFSSKWLGDNFSKNVYMGLSVSGIMLMNMFGIPVVGSDICGFIGNTNPELCARWHVVGSFYPFSRNHNAIDSIAQEPYLFKDDIYEDAVSYMDIMQRAIVNKYHLIRYYYSELMRISVHGNATFYKPLFFEFPDDQNAYSNITYNVMLGSALKLGVNSDQLGQNQTYFYFPAGFWCNVFDPRRDKCFLSTGEAVLKSSKAYDFYLHIREGHIVPMQDAKALNVMKTKDLQNYPTDFHILGAPVMVQGEPQINAIGHYFNDDGLNRTLTNSSNNYHLRAYTNNHDSANYLILDIAQTQFAYDFNSSNVYEICYAVNKNDWLGNLYFYNAKLSLLEGTFQVMAHAIGRQTQYDLGTAKYDAASDRLILINKRPTCLSAIDFVQFIKLS